MRTMGAHQVTALHAGKSRPSAAAGGQAPTATIRREDPMTSQPLRVGIVGLQPGRSWAAKAHVPALRALSADFVIAGIANTTLPSAVQAAAALDHVPRTFVRVADVVDSPDNDI